MHKSLHAQGEDIDMNALRCVLYEPHALHDHFSIFNQSYYWFVASLCLQHRRVYDSRMLSNVDFYTTTQSLGLDYSFSWVLFGAVKYFGKISNQISGSRSFKQVFYTFNNLLNRRRKGSTKQKPRRFWTQIRDKRLSSRSLSLMTKIYIT